MSVSTSSSDRNFGSAGQARGGCRSSAGLLAQTAVEDQKPVVAANGRDRARHGAGRQAAGDLLADECLERLTVERVGRHAEPGGVRRERGQVARVAFERVRGQPPLDAQMVQERVNHGPFVNYVVRCAVCS